MAAGERHPGQLGITEKGVEPHQRKNKTERENAASSGPGPLPGPEESGVKERMDEWIQGGKERERQ